MQSPVEAATATATATATARRACVDIVLVLERGVRCAATGEQENNYREQTRRYRHDLQA
jgi:hypothetical protein